MFTFRVLLCRRMLTQVFVSCLWSRQQARATTRKGSGGGDRARNWISARLCDSPSVGVQLSFTNGDMTIYIVYSHSTKVKRQRVARMMVYYVTFTWWSRKRYRKSSVCRKTNYSLGLNQALTRTLFRFMDSWEWRRFIDIEYYFYVPRAAYVTCTIYHL